MFLSKKSSLIIFENDLDKYHGSKEGINLPIEFMGEIIGVVGVTGSPPGTGSVCENGEGHRRSNASAGSFPQSITAPKNIDG